MGEKNILAYFKTVDQAEQIADQIKSMGISDVQIDRIHQYPGDTSDQLMNPATGQIGSLSDLTLGDISGDVGPLTAADTSASGMSNGGGSFVTGRDVLLAAIVDESQFDSLREQIRSNGGLI
ncbi:hypothetical protein [Desulfitobacterium sp.]|uniref:hypothetical protein n=1 Tax=Desulfitobacterium sp. TaxID=49981 RepID=UPI002D0E06B8|nr:hypothetical protein [Desulfitobacterium sp.]HVJ50044.1 hypothetical protein [Desulfitobacterium sp.]